MSFQELELRSEYRSLQQDVIKEFYLPTLKKATLYKRAVGFFSSSALVDLSVGITGLVKNGGKIQLIASPKLSDEDIDAINDGLKRKEEVIEEALLRELSEATGRFEEERLNLLSNLIATGILEIRIAFLEADNSIGMFHEKMGLMYDDDGNIIAFTGSMNESANAFHRNYEAIDVFTSWTTDEDRVLRKQAAFNAMWNDYEPNIRVVAFPKVSKAVIERYRRTSSADLTVDDRYGTHRFISCNHIAIPIINYSSRSFNTSFSFLYIPCHLAVFFRFNQHNSRQSSKHDDQYKQTSKHKYFQPRKIMYSKVFVYLI